MSTPYLTNVWTNLHSRQRGPAVAFRAVTALRLLTAYAILLLTAYVLC